MGELQQVLAKLDDISECQADLRVAVAEVKKDVGALAAAVVDVKKDADKLEGEVSTLKASATAAAGRSSVLQFMGRHAVSIFVAVVTAVATVAVVGH